MGNQSSAFLERNEPFLPAADQGGDLWTGANEIWNNLVWMATGAWDAARGWAFGIWDNVVWTVTEAWDAARGLATSTRNALVWMVDRAWTGVVAGWNWFANMAIAAWGRAVAVYIYFRNAIGWEKLFLFIMDEIMWALGVLVFVFGHWSISKVVMESLLIEVFLVVIYIVHLALLPFGSWRNAPMRVVPHWGKCFSKVIFVVGSQLFRMAFDLNDLGGFLCGGLFSIFCLVYFRLLRIVEDLGFFEAGVSISMIAILKVWGDKLPWEKNNLGEYELGGWGYLALYVSVMYAVKTWAAAYFARRDQALIVIVQEEE